MSPTNDIFGSPPTPATPAAPAPAASAAQASPSTAASPASPPAWRGIAHGASGAWGRFRHSPWATAALLAGPAAAMAYVEKCSGTALSLTLRRFTADPALMTLLGSINLLMGFTVGPAAAILSDSPVGSMRRRRVFMIVGLLLLAAAMTALPLMRSFTALIVVLVVYQFAVDLGYTGCYRPLYFDLVPERLHGRGMVLNRYAEMAGRLLFMQFLLGMFHETLFTTTTGGGAYTGEMLIYHVGAAAALIAAAVVAFALPRRSSTPAAPETPADPATPAFADLSTDAPWQRLGRRIVAGARDLADRRTWPLLALAALSVLMTAKMGVLRPMLIMRQFGYSPKQLGQIHVQSMLISAFVLLPLLGLVIDRWPRLRLILAGMAGSLASSAGFWLWVKFVTPELPPAPTTIMAFTLADSLCDQCALLALWPLLFGAAPRKHAKHACRAGCMKKKRGQLNAGVIVAMGAVHFVVNNLLGLFVRLFPLRSADKSLTGSPSGGLTGSLTGSLTGDYDYMAGYLYITLVGALALAGTWALRRRLNELDAAEA